MTFFKRMGASAAFVALSIALAFSSFVRPQIARADSIGLTPPKFELLGNPGDTVNEKIKVENRDNSDTTYQIDVEDFKAADDDGSVSLVDDPNAPATNFSLAQWVTVEPKRVTVPAGQEKVIDVTIKIPKDAEPGGHYASVLVHVAGISTAEGSASVESRVGTLVLLRVSGAITEKLNVDIFKTNESYYQQGPVEFELRTTNTGNVHVAPAGTIVITNMFGKKIQEIPLTTANVLPGSSRIVRTTLDNKGLLGRYTATLVANYGQSKQNITATTSFIVFPVYLIVIIVVVFLVLYWALRNRRKLKKILHSLTSD